MRYMLLLYGCDRPEPGDPRFEGALARVTAFTEECRKRLRSAASLRYRRCLGMNPQVTAF